MRGFRESAQSTLALAIRKDELTPAGSWSIARRCESVVHRHSPRTSISHIIPGAVKPPLAIVLGPIRGRRAEGKSCEPSHSGCGEAAPGY